MTAAPVGVVAVTMERARSIIDELGLSNAVPVAYRNGARGYTFSALIVDGSALPLSDRAYLELIPTVIPTDGQVYELRRHERV